MQACYVDDVLVPEQQFAGAKLSPTFSLFCQVTQVPFYHHHEAQAGLLLPGPWWTVHFSRLEGKKVSLASCQIRN